MKNFQIICFYFIKKIIQKNPTNYYLLYHIYDHNNQIFLH